MADIQPSPVTARFQRLPPQTRLACILGLFAFFLWQAISLHRYNQIDTRPPSWDQSIHMEIAHDYLQALKHGRISDIVFLPPKPGMPPFPPLYHLGLMLSNASQDPAHAALWLNWAYLVLLCIALLGIALHFNGDSTALVAVIAFACSPAVQWLLHTQLIDLSLVAVSACAYWAFLKSDRFRDPKISLIVGGVHAIGMLDKWSFFSYMLPLYFSALLALGDDKRRENAILAGLLSAVLFLPWYLAHLPILVPRLFQATADQAVPFWKGGAIFEYFNAMSGGLSPPLWILGWIGLLVPVAKRRREDVWILVSWVATSYLFWTIVPNRQMRFLLPGLPAMAILALGAWPKPLVWALAAFQIFTAANYTSAWVQPREISLPLLTLDFFHSEPPVHQDWKIRDILSETHRLRPKEIPFSNLTLAANDNYFNGPTFNWETKRLGMDDSIKIRGVNRRLCELSEFVLLKKGYLGPPSVIGGLPETATLIEAKDQWFQRGYSEASTWLLPDGSVATLYQQKHPRQPLFPKNSYRFPLYTTPTAPIVAKDLNISLNRWDPRGSFYESIEASADRLEFRGLPIRHLQLELQDAFILPAGDHPIQKPWEDVRFLRLWKLSILSMRLTADDLKAFIESRAKGLTVTAVDLNNRIRLDAVFRGIPLSAQAKVAIASSSKTPGNHLVITVTKASIGHIPIPVGLLGHYRALSVDLAPNPETPFTIEIPSLTLQGDTLSIP